MDVATNIWLPRKMLEELRIRAIRRRKSMAGLIREAVEQAYLAKPSTEVFSKALRAAAGIWKGRKDVGDPAAYVRNLRRGGRRDRYLAGKWDRSSSTPTS